MHNFQLHSSHDPAQTPTTHVTIRTLTYLGNQDLPVCWALFAFYRCFSQISSLRQSQHGTSCFDPFVYLPCPCLVRLINNRHSYHIRCMRRFAIRVCTIGLAANILHLGEYNMTNIPSDARAEETRATLLEDLSNLVLLTFFEQTSLRCFFALKAVAAASSPSCRL